MTPAMRAGTAVVAQCESFARKMPPFYAAIVACMIAQAIVFYGRAPFGLAVLAPLSVALVAGVRMAWWIRRRRRPFTEGEARSSLHRSKLILFVSTASIVALDTVIFQYLEDGARTFLMVELFGCTMTGVYCLMHIRSAAYVMVAALICSQFFTLAEFPPEVLLGLAITIVSLICAMTYAMQSYHEEFVSLLHTKDENHRIANLDMLTDLPNRRQFFHDLEAACAEAEAVGARVAVAIADLDGFKPINDTHGHAFGDKVLRAIAGRIAEGAAGFARAYRLGGDEFALVAAGPVDRPTLLVEAGKLIEDIGRPIRIGDVVVSVGCSIGIAIFPDAAPAPGLLWERADYALYHVKRSGRNQALLFDEEHERQLRAHGAIEQALRGADLEREFYLVYQPIIRPRDGRTLGFECLARWRSPVLGEVSPGAFIPVAEQSGLIATLTPVLLRRALREALSWPGELKVSFNLSAHDIANRERILALVGIIGSSGLSPSRIDLELTETALLHSFDIARENMGLLKQIGVSISLDDFGTGYSSLSHVHALPLDKIKIDRSFVSEVVDSASSQTIVRSMLTMCRDLDIACIVEGVETSDQAAALTSLGCEQIQGYYFSRPMPAQEIAAFLDGPTKQVA